MPTTDEAVLRFIAGGGGSAEAIARRFPGFDVSRLVRAQLVEAAHEEAAADAEAHLHDSVEDVDYVLTSLGASAIGAATPEAAGGLP